MKHLKAGLCGLLSFTAFTSFSYCEKSTVTGELSHVAVHDPSIISTKNGEKNTYYIFGTHITAAKSSDLANWKIFTNGYTAKENTIFDNLSENLAEPFAWAGENDSDCKGGFSVWAPHVIYNERYVNEDGSKGAYMNYFCTSSTYCRSAIAYAVSDRIDGGYKYKGTLIYSGFTESSAFDNNSNHDKIWTNTNIDELMEEGRIDKGFDSNWATAVHYNTDYAPNAIDPTIFTDSENRMWMCYGSWSGGIYLLEINPATGDAIYPKTTGLTEDGRVIDKYFGIRIACGHTKSGEGPFILYDKETGYYYLYVTYNFLDAISGYNMRLFRAKDPTGPYLDAAGNNAVFESRKINQYEKGLKVMGNYGFSCIKDAYRSPGHCSSFIDDDGQMYLFYHTRFEIAGDNFQTRVHQQFMAKNGWPVTAVFENRGDKIQTKGYSSKEIIGNYEFINHGTENDKAEVRHPITIRLNADGSITGEATGTWQEEKGSPYATFVIDGKSYEGVFFAQHNEAKKSKLVMTFTAVGENNMTVWAVRKSK